MSKDSYQLLYSSGSTYNIPLFLEANADELGVMVGFDGYMEQVEQLVNFTYEQSGYFVTIYNSINPDRLRKIIEQTYTIDFGDGYSENLIVNKGMPGSDLPSVTHMYASGGTYNITITLISPWETKNIKKELTVPQDITITNPLGVFTGMIVPAYNNLSGQTQEYLNDLDYTNNTGFTTFTYVAFGKSKIEQLKKYGSETYSGVTISSDDNGVYSGYTIDGFYYKDYGDGYTMITGSTEAYTREDVFNTMITRNEHFIGFIDEPTIYSDIFVDRGKLGVMEQNFRLSEVDSIGELEVYGNGFFTIKKQ